VACVLGGYLIMAFKHGRFPHSGGVAYGAKVGYCNPAGKSMAARVQSRRENVDKRFKNWAILSCTMYCYKFSEHQTVFGAIVVIIRFSLAVNPLFHVQYNDK
jgi:hypothetical protein